MPCYLKYLLYLCNRSFIKLILVLLQYIVLSLQCLLVWFSLMWFYKNFPNAQQWVNLLVRLYLFLYL